MMVPPKAHELQILRSLVWKFPLLGYRQVLKHWAHLPLDGGAEHITDALNWKEPDFRKKVAGATRDSGQSIQENYGLPKHTFSKACEPFKHLILFSL